MLQLYEHSGYHVIGQLCLHELQDGFLVKQATADNVSYQALVCLFIFFSQNYRLVHTRTLPQHVFHLSYFHPVAADLNLVIGAANK